MQHSSDGDKEEEEEEEEDLGEDEVCSFENGFPK